MYQAAADRYEKMQYKRCGRSGILLPRISLGLWQNFGLEKPLEHQREVLCRAFDLGITHFDLANNYGFPARGKAEENFGAILKSDLGVYRDGQPGSELEADGTGVCGCVLPSPAGPGDAP